MSTDDYYGKLRMLTPESNKAIRRVALNSERRNCIESHLHGKNNGEVGELGQEERDWRR